MTFEEISALVMQLSPLEQAKLVERIMGALQEDLQAVHSPQPRRSFYGILRDLGHAPSAEDIDEVRREFMSDFEAKVSDDSAAEASDWEAELREIQAELHEMELKTGMSSEVFYELWKQEKALDTHENNAWAIMIEGLRELLQRKGE
jgi:hypothetical protein